MLLTLYLSYHHFLLNLSIIILILHTSSYPSFPSCFVENCLYSLPSWNFAFYWGIKPINKIKAFYSFVCWFCFALGRGIYREWEVLANTLAGDDAFLKFQVRSFLIIYENQYLKSCFYYVVLVEYVTCIKLGTK